MRIGSRGYGQACSSSNSSDEPNEPHRGNGNARHLELTSLHEAAVAQVDEPREDQGDNAELADLDAEVEHQEGGRHFGARQRDFAQRPSKTEAMDEPEDERDAPAPSGVLDEPVLDADVGDRQGDRRFDEPRSGADDTERRQAQRDRMRDGERGDRPKERTNGMNHEQEPEQKQEMVVTGQDVLDAHA